MVSCLVLLVACACAAGLDRHPGSVARGHLAASGRGTQPPVLAVGERVRGELERGEEHTYRLALPAGEYVRIEVAQEGTDLLAEARSPGGELIALADRLIGLSAPEVLELVSREEGIHLLTVKAVKGDEAGSYEVRFLASHPATAEEEERFSLQRRAQELFDRALELARPAGEAEEGSGERLAAAAEACREARTLWQRLGARDDEAFAVHTLGRIASSLNRIDEALARYSEALALWDEAGNHTGKASTLNNMGILYRLRGDPERALAAYSQALEIFAAEGWRRNQVNTLFNLGILYGQLGRVEEALTAFNQAAEMGGEAGEAGARAALLNQLGVQYRRLGEITRALDLHQRALDLSRAAGDARAEAGSLINLGAAHHDLGRDQEALDDYREAERIAHELGLARVEAQAAHNRASRYLDLGEEERALEYYRRALGLYEATGDLPGQADSLRNLGLFYHRRGEPAAAIENLERALAMSRSLGDRWREAQALSALGVAYHSSGRSEEALASFAEAREIQVSLGDRPGRARTLKDSGKVRLDLDELEGAGEDLQRCLALSQEIGDPDLEASCLAMLAQLDRRRGDLFSAKERIEQALELMESVRGGLVNTRLRTTFFGSLRPFYDLYIDLLMRLDEAYPGEGFRAEALVASERSHARGLAELLAEARVEVRHGVPEELRQRSQELDASWSAIQRRLIDLGSQREAPEAEISALRRRLMGVAEEREQVEVEIRRRHPRYAAVRYPAPLGEEEIRALLPDAETALLEYSMGEEEAYLFVLADSGLHVFDLGPTAPLADLVLLLRRGLEPRSTMSLASYLASAYQLYRSILAPAGDLLADKRRLIIVPDGSLFYVPFEALLTAAPRAGEPPAYLLHRWTVSYAPSATVLASLDSAPRASPGTGGARKTFIAFADPLYAAAPGGDGGDRHRGGSDVDGGGGAGGAWRLASLAASRQEVRRIAQLFDPGEVALYLGRDASEANVRDNPALPTARWIHFATHGATEGGDPSRYGLVLSLGEDSPYDGLLQLHEIFNLELSAELVVLSACDSGLGREVRGEGLVGLSRGFLYAGARSLVVSLWRVEDESTAELMVRFYGHLQSSGDRAEALRAAKLEMVARPGFAHPTAWASFILIGSLERSGNI